MTSTDVRKPTGTESGRKLLSVLLCFTGARPQWSIAEIADELGLTASSAYRYVGQLRDSGLLEAASGNNYRVTDRVIGLAKAAEAGSTALLDIAIPVMTALRDEIGETVLVARRSGESAYCIDRVESLHAVRLQFNRGQPMSLHNGSMPRLLLAHMPPHERDRYVERVLPTVPENRRPMLSAEALDRTAQVGNTESMAEIDEGIWGCAAVIRRGHEVIAVLGTAGPVYRLDSSRRREIRSLVVNGAARISASL